MPEEFNDIELKEQPEEEMGPEHEESFGIPGEDVEFEEEEAEE
jgi:hypothetical protein